MRGGYRDTGVEDYMCTLRPAENDVALVEAVQGRLARTATTRVTSFTITCTSAPVCQVKIWTSEIFLQRVVRRPVRSALKCSRATLHLRFT